MLKRVEILKFSRQLHLYSGAFLSPAILFFAFTGAMQTLSLHEAAKNGTYKPAQWIVELSQIHKKQTTQLPAPKPQPAAMPKEGPRKHASSTVSQVDAEIPAATQARNTAPLKAFFLLVSLGLTISTITGIYMAYMHTRRRVVVTILIAAGIAVPVLLALLQ